MHIISFTYGLIDMSVYLNIRLLYFVCTFTLHIAPLPPPPKKTIKKSIRKQNNLCHVLGRK